MSVKKWWNDNDRGITETYLITLSLIKNPRRCGLGSNSFLRGKMPASNHLNYAWTFRFYTYVISVFNLKIL